jgi:hypothetical protein
MKGLQPLDLEKLHAAAQAAEMAEQALRDLVMQAYDLLLVEMAVDQLTEQVKIKQKLERILTLVETTDSPS